MITITNLVKHYFLAPVVDIHSLEIRKGECVGLVGNNGAGKTTLFRMLLDLVRPTQGGIKIDGKAIHGMDDWKSRIGSYLDESFLISYLTPDEYFKFVGELYGYNEAQLKTILAPFEIMFNGEILGSKKLIRDLSKGNIKKVGIAAAFIGEPEIIVLDEPFENLDPTSQIRLKDLIIEHYNVRHTTFLISSHDLNHITSICNRIVLMEKGKVVKDINGGTEGLLELESYFKARANGEAVSSS